MEPSFDPAKDVINRAKHGLSLAFGARIFEDDNHLVIPSIRPQDKEDRFKVVAKSETSFSRVFQSGAEGCRGSCL